jgi:hypothetical protein
MSSMLNTGTFKEEKFTLWCGSLSLVAFDLKILYQRSTTVFFGGSPIYWNKEKPLNLLIGTKDLEHLDWVIINFPHKVAYEQRHFLILLIPELCIYSWRFKVSMYMVIRVY